MKKTSPKLQAYLPHILLAFTLVIASVVRLWRLGSLPPGLVPVEAVSGLRAVAILHHWSLGQIGHVQAPGGGVLVVWQALAIKFFGQTVLALRLPVAIAGILAVAATYLWVNSWFGRRSALIAAWFMAVMPWAVTFSRLAVSASLVPLFVGLTLWGLGLWLQKNSRAGAALAIVSLLTGLYASPAFWGFAIALGICTLTALLWRPEWSSRRSNAGLALLAVVGVVPLAAFAAVHYRQVSHFVTTHSFTSGVHGIHAQLAVFGGNALRVLGAYHWQGDLDYTHNLGGLPMVNIFIGIMLVLGLLICLRRWRHLRYLVMLVLLAGGLLMGIVTSGDTPNALRLLATLPLVAALAALGVNYMLGRWYTTFPVNGVARNAGLALIVLLLLLSAYEGYKHYFVAWAQDPKTYTVSREDLSVAAKQLRELGTYKGTVYLVDSPDSDQVLRYLAPKVSYQVLTLDQLQSLPLSPVPRLVIIEQSDEALAARTTLEAKFMQTKPQGRYSSFDGSKLYEYYEFGQ